MPSNTNNTVLICDDDEDILFLANAFLSKNKIIVLKATTGKDAISLYREKKQEISLVILDNTFKNSDLQGRDILIALKKEFPDIKVLMSSGYPESYFKDTFPPEAFRLIDGFVDKNYSSPNFVKTLEPFFSIKPST